ncbi:MAG: hypothetical protein ABI137_09260 [Antricoccus sp.]
MRKLFLIAAIGIGYVLGAKAGRARYEQIMRTSRKLRENPQIQGVAGMINAQAENVVSTVKDKIGNDLH